MINKQTCACCGFKAVDGFGDICEICFYESDCSEHEGGLTFANHGVHLMDAQTNYKKFGVSDIRFKNNVREPNEFDIKDKLWRPMDFKRDTVITNYDLLEKIQIENRPYWLVNPN